MYSLFSKFTSEKPELRLPLSPTQDQSATSITHSSIPLSRSTRRRFPRRLSSGMSMTKLSSQKWIHPIFKLEEALHNPFLEKQRSSSKIAFAIKPLSWWKPLSVALSKVPGNLSAAVDKHRGYTANLQRSPDRVISLKNATERGVRIRKFGLSEAMVYSYLKDHRFVLLTCLLIGFSAWWILLPEQLLVHPLACCSGEYATLITEILTCPMRNLGFPCIYADQIHDRAVEVFTEPELFDPLKLKPDNRTIAPANMIGAIVLVLALGDSVTSDGIII